MKNLSEKIWTTNIDGNDVRNVDVKDVKEFIKRIKEKIRDSKAVIKLSVPFIWDVIDKEAGKELI